MELWIPVTIFAAFTQNLRMALQKHLKERLSTGGATYARFIYAVPLAYLYFWFLVDGAGFPAITPHAEFLIYGAVGGIAQILATALLVYLFSFRNFAVGTAYSKTETIQMAVFGLILLGDGLTMAALIAILISLMGLVALSAVKTGMRFRQLLSGIYERTALIGIASGAMLAVCSVCYRAAALSLGGEGFLVQAGTTLVWALTVQTVLMGIYLGLREPGQLRRVLAAWRVAGLVGVTGAAASIGWFTAMTIQNAAYVRALGQIELVFTFIAAHYIFRERATAMETGGIALVVAGILILLLG